MGIDRVEIMWIGIDSDGKWSGGIWFGWDLIRVGNDRVGFDLGGNWSGWELIGLELIRVGIDRVGFDLGGIWFGWEMIGWDLIWVGIDRVGIVRGLEMNDSQFGVYYSQRQVFRQLLKVNCSIYFVPLLSVTSKNLQKSLFKIVNMTCFNSDNSLLEIK